MKQVYALRSDISMSLVLRVVAVIAVLAIWILIDKGNVYGQNAHLGQQVKQTDLTLGEGDGVLNNNTANGSGMVVFPNPVKDVLVFDFEFTVRGEGVAQCHIVNAIGQTVLKGEVSTNGGPAAMMRVDGLRPGLYMVCVKSGGKELVTRIIKQ